MADAAIGVVRERAGLAVTCLGIGMCRALMRVLVMAEMGGLTLLLMRADARRRSPGPLERQQEHQHDVEDAAHEGRESNKAVDRFAGESEETRYEGPFEILTLSGTVTRQGAHLHMSIASSEGDVRGGHVVYGNVVRTTAELLLVQAPEWELLRERDAATGFLELVASRRAIKDEP